MASSWRRLAEAYAVATLREAAALAARQFPDILWLGDPRLRQVALSFDDGPHPVDTPALLNVLARHGVTASFCWLGELAARHPELVTRAAAAGHQLMIHGYRHRSFLLEPPAELRQMLDRTRQLLARHSGRDPSAITSVRPPYGHLSAPIVRRLLAWGYQPVVCSVMPIHWMQPSRLSVEQVLAQTAGGSLIVLHEGLGGPPVAALTDRILAGLAGSGLQFVSIDTLRAGRAAAGGGPGRAA